MSAMTTFDYGIFLCLLNFVIINVALSSCGCSSAYICLFNWLFFGQGLAFVDKLQCIFCVRHSKNVLLSQHLCSVCVFVLRCIPTLLHVFLCNFEEWLGLPCSCAHWNNFQSVHGLCCYSNVCELSCEMLANANCLYLLHWPFGAGCQHNRCPDYHHPVISPRASKI